MWLFTDASSLLIKLKRFKGNSLVKISANCLSMLTNSSMISPFLASPLRKCYLISMSLVLECWIRFFERLMTLVSLQKYMNFIKFEFKNPLVFVSSKGVEPNNSQPHYIEPPSGERQNFAFLLLCNSRHFSRK